MICEQEKVHVKQGKINTFESRSLVVFFEEVYLISVTYGKQMHLLVGHKEFKSRLYFVTIVFPIHLLSLEV